MNIQPVITEAKRNELRKRAAHVKVSHTFETVAVTANDLLDLLDAADREVDLLEGIEQIYLDTIEVKTNKACRALLGRDS